MNIFRKLLKFTYLYYTICMTQFGNYFFFLLEIAFIRRFLKINPDFREGFLISRVRNKVQIYLFVISFLKFLTKNCTVLLKNYLINLTSVKQNLF